jgi:4-carboxymuconolactone decarboxylase
LLTCAAARHVSNQFEWVMHAPLAVKAGVSPEAMEALRQGARPRDLAPDEEDALNFAQELLVRHGVSDPTYQSALARWGEQGVVELTTLLGYFAMVSWLMNVARTPAQSGATGPGIDAFPL